MVITCYNKEVLINRMFDSILVQEWDNIELILVNDGSTDRTLDKIIEYAQKFISRGFDAIIIDKENQGVSAAARNGLLCTTGEYVCLIDADDELDPRYVSMMASWLDNNQEYDLVACDSIKVQGDITIHFPSFPNGEKEFYDLENWLLWRVKRGVWIYMVRDEYLKKCKVREHFYTGRDGNQEPQFIFPLMLGGGNIKYIKEPLYKYIHNESDDHRSNVGSYDKSKKRWSGFIKALYEIIQGLPLNGNEKKRLCAVSDISHNLLILKDALELGTATDINDAFERLLNRVKLYYSPTLTVLADIALTFPAFFCIAVEESIQGVLPDNYGNISGRVIAWGASGQNASQLLPHLIGTDIEPVELWDVGLNGKNIKKPDVASLTENDVVLVLPSKNDAVSEIKTALEESKCCVIPFECVRTYVCARLFPGLYKGKVCLMS